MTNALPVLGAPGVYFAPDLPSRELRAEPMDVVAFVGVAPRGPAWEPVSDRTLVEAGTPRARSVAVPVDSWDGYVERFGAFEGPGLLPHAVAAFFAQGGRRAYVVRIVHDEIAWDGSRAMPLGCAHHTLSVRAVRAAGGGAVRFRARNEGLWGERLSLTLSFAVRPLAVRATEPGALVFERGAQVLPGTLVRLRAGDGSVRLRWITTVRWRGRLASTGHDLIAELDDVVLVPPVQVEQVEAELTVLDRDPDRRRAERFDRLGLRPGHPRWVPDVLTAESRLVEVADPLAGIDVLDATLPPAQSEPVTDPDLSGLRAADRWHLVTPDDVFGRLLGGDESGTEGLDALLLAPEVASIVAPDLYCPAEPPATEPVTLPGSLAGPTFAPCVDQPSRMHPPPSTLPLVGLRLDPADAGDLERITLLQQQLVAVAERLRCVALLDVPPGLRRQAIMRWRSRFDSSFAAAYHPWLRAPSGGRAGPLVDLNPSAVAAGILARTELRQGVPHGPANEPSVGVVHVTDRVDDERHGDLHQAGIDVFRRQPDGVWLTGARTLSAEGALRQLSVRRLLLLLQRSVARQLQWVVFEPNDELLRAGLTRMLEGLLGGLDAQGAFAGATPAESWFVHVAEGRDVGLEADRGQVVVEIGVAPAEPAEFIVVRVSLDAEGSVETRLRVGSGVITHG
ncbi:MAG: phage tail sheath subtilisin-like domain-containing protein [Egibacteraceae bacterium]